MTGNKYDRVEEGGMLRAGSVVECDGKQTGKEVYIPTIYIERERKIKKYFAE